MLIKQGLFKDKERMRKNDRYKEKKRQTDKHTDK